MIAAPSDVTEEKKVIRHTIDRWNALHSESQGVVLTPISWDTHSRPAMGASPQDILNSQLLHRSDLLVAVFWTRLGTPTDKAVSGTVEEIEEHIKAEKPVMIYFSNRDAPRPASESELQQIRRLNEFIEACRPKGLVEDYNTLEEFKGKIYDQLSVAIREDLQAAHKDVQAGSRYTKKPIGDIFPEHLLEDIESLLLAASEAGDGTIHTLQSYSGYCVETGSHTLVNTLDGREKAKWLEVIACCENTGLIDPVGYEGNIFRLTHLGYEAGDKLRAART